MDGAIPCAGAQPDGRHESGVEAGGAAGGAPDRGARRGGSGRSGKWIGTGSPSPSRSRHEGRADAGGVMTLDFTVSGVPIPQGSLRAFLVKGRPVVTADNRRDLGTWRQEIAAGARRAGAVVCEGPVEIMLTFRLPRPRSRPTRVRWPDRRPDLDKLTRAVLDALTGVAWRDDGQVVAIRAVKAYVDSMTAPTSGLSVSVTEAR